MKESMSSILKDKSTEELRSRKDELYKKIVIKQKIINRYRYLITQITGNCSEYIREYKILDRVIFFREDRVKIISDKRRVSDMQRREKSISEMSEKERDLLLKQLIEIRNKRQSEETSI